MNINLNDLNFDNIGQWPYAVKLGILISSIVLILGLGFLFYIAPNFESLNTLEVEEKTLRQEFENKQHKASSLAAYQQQLKEIQERFANLVKQLPAENEMPGLLENISKTGISVGLNFELFAPQAEIKHDFYIELPIKIRVTGTYNQLAIFLSHVAELNRIVTLHDFVITSPLADNTQQNNQGNKVSDKLTMDITAKIYWYRANDK